jgi:hypothetical protein
MFKDILEALQTWPKWKRVESAPDRIDALEIRLEELERRLARCPGDGCPKCGELTFRVVRSYPDGNELGTIIREMKCEKCSYTESRTMIPK